MESFCASQLSSPGTATPVVITWGAQSERLWPEAQRFAAWHDVAYDASAESLADRAILERVRNGRWSRQPPRVGRVIASRLTQALAVIQVNALASDPPGVTMPSGLSASAQTSAFLIYWCYAMELPLAETGGAAAGLA